MYRRMMASQVRTFLPNALSSAVTDEVNRARGTNVQTGPPTLGSAYVTIATAAASSLMNRFSGSHTESQRVSVAQTSVGLPISQARSIVTGNYPQFTDSTLNALRARELISPSEHSAMQLELISTSRTDPSFADSVQSPNENYFSVPDT